MNFTTNDKDVKRWHQTTAIRATLGTKIIQHLAGREDGVFEDIGLTLAQRMLPVAPMSHIYEPSLAIIVQGKKHVLLGKSSYQYDAAHFLLTTVDIPVVSEVLDANPEKPFIAALVKINLTKAREVMTHVDVESSVYQPGSALAIGPSTIPIFDAFSRLIDLLETPQDIPVMADLIERELLYRVLTSSAGLRLRHIVMAEHHANRITRAVGWLRENYAKPFRAEELATLCGMGVSTLYHQFRDLTAMSPVQYQKRLRLYEARRLLLNDGLDAGNAAFTVGYESTTQFNREYHRLFGAPPIRDVKTIHERNAPAP